LEVSRIESRRPERSRVAEATGRLAKTDRVDAAMLARMGALLEPQLHLPADEIFEDLKDLRLTRCALIKDAPPPGTAASICVRRCCGGRTVSACVRSSGTLPLSTRPSRP
jgi:hypothetical protein